MPLRPDLGGFGMFSPFILCLLDSISRSSWPKRRNADDDSGQDESVRSKFPSRFLQDTLLGFFDTSPSLQDSRDRVERIGGDMELLVLSMQSLYMHSARSHTLLQNRKLHLSRRDLPLATLPRVY